MKKSPKRQPTKQAGQHRKRLKPHGPNQSGRNLPRSADEIYRVLKAGVSRALALDAPSYLLAFHPSQEDWVEWAWRKFERRDRLLLRRVCSVDVKSIPGESRLLALVVKFQTEQWCLIQGGDNHG